MIGQSEKFDLDNEIMNLEAIAVNLEILISSDNDSVSNTEHYSNDLELIQQKIQEKKTEAIMSKFDQIEPKDAMKPQDEKCANCCDEKAYHENQSGPCNKFGTCQCKQFVSITLDSLEFPFVPGDIEN